ncbi:MAG: hypothetical protein ACREC8_04750 [Limisphaerales bacterium]
MAMIAGRIVNQIGVARGRLRSNGQGTILAAARRHRDHSPSKTFPFADISYSVVEQSKFVSIREIRV